MVKMWMACAVRAMVEEDIDSVAAIEARSFAAPWTMELFREILSSSVSEGYVIGSGREAKGYIVFYAAADEAHILNLAVHPALRRRGYGRRLMEFAIEELAGRGVRSFFLEVREGNAGARGLYRRLGFEYVGRRKGYYRETGEDALIMVLATDSAPGA